jgi:hypothetical protein
MSFNGLPSLSETKTTMETVLLRDGFVSSESGLQPIERKKIRK